MRERWKSRGCRNSNGHWSPVCYRRPHALASCPITFRIHCRLSLPHGGGWVQGLEDPHFIGEKTESLREGERLAMVTRVAEAAPETGFACARFHPLCFRYVPLNFPSSSCHPQKVHGEKNAVNSQLFKTPFCWTFSPQHISITPANLIFASPVCSIAGDEGRDLLISFCNVL